MIDNINLNKEGEFSNEHTLNDLLDNNKTINHSDWYVELELNRKKIVVNVDIDCEYSVFTEEGERGRMHYWESELNMVYVGKDKEQAEANAKLIAAVRS